MEIRGGGSMQEGRKVGKGIWYALIFSLVSFYLIFQVVVKISFRQSFQKINWFFIVLGFGVLFLMWLAKALRMYSVGKGMGIPIPFGFYLQLYLATCFISHVTPFNAGGTPLQIYLLHKKGIAVGRATALTVVDLGLNTLMFFILIPVAVGVSFHSSHLAHSFQFQAMLPGILIVLVGIAVIWILFYYTKLGPKLMRSPLIMRFKTYLRRKGWIQHFKHEWERFQEGWLSLFHHHPKRLWLAITATILYWFFYLLLAPLIFWAMGRMVSFFELIGLQLLFNFAQVFIPTPGGSGGSELLLVYIFKNILGVSRAGTFVLLWKSYTFFSTLIVGSFYFWKLTKRE
jgi:glycosyltransferase 2 family protein